MNTSTAERSKLGYGVSLDAGVVREELVRQAGRQLARLPYSDRVWQGFQWGMVRALRLGHPTDRPAPCFSPALSDNVQRTMNLIMPLRNPGPVGRTKLIELFVHDGEVILTALRNVGCVHSARFDLLGDNLCLFSVYDGDFAGYIRDFIVTAGTFFTNLFRDHIKDPPATPVSHHADEFIEWVALHDLPQLPEDVAELCPDFEYMPRCLATLLQAWPNVQIFSYSQYPSYTAAQIRERLHIGW